MVVTARPSYSRIKTALAAIRDHPQLNLQLVVAASALLDRYGSVIEQIEADGFDITARVFMVLEGENPTSMAKTTGLGVIELATVLHNLEPDVVVTVADRYETLATAVAASYMNIPLAHVQGGEVSGSIDEKVRHSVTKLADIHFVATAMAGERVIKLGEDPSRVFVTGCPSIDLAADTLADSVLDFDPIERYGGVGHSFQLSNGYVVVMQHPVTTEYARARFHVEQTLLSVAESGIPALWFWPNVDAGSDGTSTGIRAFREFVDPPNIRFFKNMAPQDFLKIMFNSKVIIGNSSVAIREGSFIGTPAVDIGVRQRNRERGANVVSAGYDSADILAKIRHQFEHGPYLSENLYGDGKSGEYIAELLVDVPLTTDKQLTY